MSISAELPSRSLIEVFGYDPRDVTPIARKFWALNACPFVGRSCIKFDHANEICYGTCSVSSSGNNVIICPNRLYADNYKSIRRVSEDAFGEHPFMLFDDYIKSLTNNSLSSDCVVALGQNSGKEVKLSRMSMDWVLAHIKDGKLMGYVGVEVQSIDITGNYRDAWYAARDKKLQIPPSSHGLNWANVHKRLIPQIIRKSLVYSRSKYVKRGLYFIAPDSVYKKFEEIIGEIPLVDDVAGDVISVFTYDLGPMMGYGHERALSLTRVLRFKMDDFSSRFISGPDLPSGDMLDNKIRSILLCD